MKNNILTFVSVAAIFMLIISQVVWVKQLMERDKQRFKMELEETLQNIVTFSLSKELSKKGSANKQDFELIPLDASKLPPGAIIKGSFDTKEYSSDKNLGNFLVGVFAEDLLLENQISLEPIDSLFQREFPHYAEIAAYTMSIQKNDSLLSKLFIDEKDSMILDASNRSVNVSIPLGETGTFRYTAQVVFKPTIYIQRLRSVSALSAIAVILISILLLNQLVQLKRKSVEIDIHKTVVRGIVHDLKSPLAYVFTMLDSFEDNETYEPNKKKYNIAKIRVKHLSKKIEILLSTLRNEKNKLHIQPETFNVTQNCLDILKELKVVYRAKNISHVMQPDNDVLIRVDPIYFEACLRNLLDNAIKYAKNDVLLNISINFKNNQMTLSIADNGKGILANEQKKIFNEFYRSHKDSSLNSHGIGLFFSQRIVQAHSGKILLESVFGKGSTFTIVLPQ